MTPVICDALGLMCAPAKSSSKVAPFPRTLLQRGLVEACQPLDDPVQLVLRSALLLELRDVEGVDGCHAGAEDSVGRERAYSGRAEVGVSTMTEGSQRVLWVMRVLSAVLLLITGGIHLYLIFNGVGGILGVAFALNGVAGIVLAIAMIALRGRLLLLASVLSLLFLIATLLALVLALTVGLFGITQTWDFMLVPQTVIVESIGIVVLAITTVLLLRAVRRPDVAR
jgi:hypothetical protein